MCPYSYASMRDKTTWGVTHEYYRTYGLIDWTAIQERDKSSIGYSVADIFEYAYLSRGLMPPNAPTDSMNEIHNYAHKELQARDLDFRIDVITDFEPNCTIGTVLGMILRTPRTELVKAWWPEGKAY